MSPMGTIIEEHSSSSQILNLKAAAYFNHSFDKLGRSLPSRPSSAASSPCVLSSPSSPSSPSDSDQQLKGNIDGIRRRREAARLRYQKIRSNIIMSREIEQSSQEEATEHFDDSSVSASVSAISIEEASVQEQSTSSCCKKIERESSSMSGVTDLILDDKDDELNNKYGHRGDCDYGTLHVIYL